MNADDVRLVVARDAITEREPVPGTPFSTATFATLDGLQTDEDRLVDALVRRTMGVAPVFRIQAPTRGRR